MSPDIGKEGRVGLVNKEDSRIIVTGLLVHLASDEWEIASREAMILGIQPIDKGKYFFLARLQTPIFETFLANPNMTSVEVVEELAAIDEEQLLLAFPEEMRESVRIGQFKTAVVTVGMQVAQADLEGKSRKQFVRTVGAIYNLANGKGLSVKQVVEDGELLDEAIRISMTSEEFVRGRLETIERYSAENIIALASQIKGDKGEGARKKALYLSRVKQSVRLVVLREQLERFWGSEAVMSLDAELQGRIDEAERYLAEEETRAAEARAEKKRLDELEQIAKALSSVFGIRH